MINIWMSVLLTLSIKVVLIWVSLMITTFSQIYDCVSSTRPPVCHIVYVYEWSDEITTTWCHRFSFESLIDESVPLGSLVCMCFVEHTIVTARYHRCFFGFTDRWEGSFRITRLCVFHRAHDSFGYLLTKS